MSGTRSYFSTFLRLSSCGILFVVLVLAMLNPNPFDNAPDSIGDESYFLTSSFHAIQQHTLPGWEFSPEGSYYGGVETYIDFAVLVPVVGAVVVAKHSVSGAEFWIALHTGDLLHVLRLVSGVLTLALIGYFAYFFARKRIPAPLVQQLLLLLFLVCGSSLFMGLVHTAKVWVIAVLLDVGVGTLFLANEYFIVHQSKPLLSNRAMAALFLWSGIAAFAQTFVGVFSIFLWMVYALLLRHLSIQDLISYLRKYWYFFVLFMTLQISFIYRALFIEKHASLIDFAGNSPYTTGGVASGTIDWFHRLCDPIMYAVQSQPFIILYPIGVLLAVLFAARHSWFRDNARRRLYLIIAGVHPVLVFLFYHGLIGFSIFPRYAIMIMVAASFSVVMLLGQRPILRGLALAAAGLLFLVVSVHSIQLYWRPSSTVVLEDMIAISYNSPTNTFIIDGSAWRFALPMNEDSLLALGDTRKSMGRFDYLLGHLDDVQKAVSFEPTVMYADTSQEEQSIITQAVATSTPKRTAWVVSTDCSVLCSVQEVAQNTCFELNLKACGIAPQEPDTLPVFLSANQLGNAYIVRAVPTTQ